jgi:4-coumarate--CoA ligase
VSSLSVSTLPREWLSRFCSINSGANPEYTTPELLYQLTSSKASLIFVWPEPDFVDKALKAAKEAGIPTDRVILIASSTSSLDPGLTTLEDLVRMGAEQPIGFREPQIDARTKLAFLSYSSGESTDVSLWNPYITLPLSSWANLLHPSR